MHQLLSAMARSSSILQLLTSSTRDNFAVHRTWLYVGDKAFSVAAPRVWNALPSDIKLSPSCASPQEAQDLLF